MPIRPGFGNRLILEYDGIDVPYPVALDKTTALRPGRRFEVLAVHRLDDGFMASPAVVGRALVLRIETHLCRIEKP